MKTFLMAAAAYMLTFMVVMLAGVGALKAEEQKKEKGKGGKIEVTEEKTGEGSRTEAAVGKPLAGFSNLLDKALKKNIKVIKILLENHEKEQEWKKQEQERRERLQKDINLTAEVIYWENWYTDKNKEAAYDTGAVAWNRVKSPEFPDTLEGVLYQKGQYSTTKYFFTQELPKECYEMAEDIVLNGTPDVPETVLFQATFKQGKVWKVINGEYFCFG
ncbi:MAG: cell wall hydrolase [Lachnospiraceae bacterium]|nr:cell wall hydrolase [Lachnospiraceae bacterium]